MDFLDILLKKREGVLRPDADPQGPARDRV